MPDQSIGWAALPVMDFVFDGEGRPLTDHRYEVRFCHILLTFLTFITDCKSELELAEQGSIIMSLKNADM